MFGFFKKKSRQTTEIISRDDNDSDEEKVGSSVTSAAGIAATESARVSVNQAAKTFAKPDKYTGNRHLYDSGTAKKGVKMDSFASGGQVRDPYTNDLLELRKADAKLKYGDEWQRHLAEGDHITPIEKIYDAHGKSSWIKNEDINDLANSKDNLQTVSRKFNNAKRSKTNEEFVNDDAYLEKTGVRLTEEGKQKAIETGRKSQDIINRNAKKTIFKNVVKTGHEAGKYSAKNSGITAATMSGIMNITSVIKGEKSAEDALADTMVDTGKAAVTGYVMGGGLTTVSHTLSSSSSKFLRGLSASNVPGKVITAVMITGDTLKRYSRGEITTQECIIELGEKGLNFATTGYAMAIGQALIPIPIVGAAVGALVGSVLTGNYYNSLVNTLRTRELEHQERLRIIAECERAAREERAFREELEEYLEEYFQDFQDCFDEALSEIKFAFQAGDADGIIAGANQITRKLGGKVQYENITEFKSFLDDDSEDEL